MEPKERIREMYKTIDTLMEELEELYNEVTQLTKERDHYMNEAENYLVQLKGRHNVD